MLLLKLIANYLGANLPELEDFPEQTIVLKMNETGVQINCTLKHTNETLMVPVTLHWEKDGKVKMEKT